MNVLLDTQAMLFFFWDDPQLSQKARATITDPANRKLVSLASCWELAIKVSTGKLSIGEPAKTYLPRELAANNFELLPITMEHATTVESLPYHHRDPFDRLLITQAMIEKMPIVSADAAFDSYGIPRIW
jgi:PIN domain nuclease of toxin-antitoxin system